MHVVRYNKLVLDYQPGPNYDKVLTFTTFFNHSEVKCTLAKLQQDGKPTQLEHCKTRSLNN